MLAIAGRFWSDEAGVLVSSELVLVATISVLGIIVGLAEVATAINHELNDLSDAIGALNQSFVIPGFHSAGGNQGFGIGANRAIGANAWVAGSQFFDNMDPGDFNQVVSIAAASETPQ